MPLSSQLAVPRCLLDVLEFWHPADPGADKGLAGGRVGGQGGLAVEHTGLDEPESGDAFRGAVEGGAAGTAEVARDAVAAAGRDGDGAEAVPVHADARRRHHPVDAVDAARDLAAVAAVAGDLSLVVVFSLGSGFGCPIR